MEFTLLWAALTAALFGWIGLRAWSDGVPDNAFDHLIMASVTGLAVGRLAAMVAQGVNPIANLPDVIFVRGGVDTAAASVGFIVTLAWTSRKSIRSLDAIAPATLFALAGWHAGCVWRSACLGTVSDLPWTWGLDGSSVTRHPVELYAAAGLAVGAWLVSRLGWRLMLRAGSALATAAGMRLLTEPLRPSITGGPIWWYVAGIACGLLIVVLGALSPAGSRAPT